MFRRSPGPTRLWNAVAAAHRGRVTSGPNGPRIEVPHPHGRIIIDTIGSQAPASRGMRARALLGRELELDFQVQRQGAVDQLAKRLGMVDIEVGHPEFDAHFIVDAGGPALMRRLWSSRACDLMLHGFADDRLECFSRVLELTAQHPWQTPDQFAAAIELLATLADRDIYGRDVLASLAPEELVVGARGVPTVRLRAPALVAVETSVIADALATVARLEQRPELEPCTVALAAGGRALELDAVARLPGRAQALLSQVGPGRLVIDGAGARFEFPAIEGDAARIRAAAALLGALTAGPSQGIFR